MSQQDSINFTVGASGQAVVFVYFSAANAKPVSVVADCNGGFTYGGSPVGAAVRLSLTTVADYLRIDSGPVGQPSYIAQGLQSARLTSAGCKLTSFSNLLTTQGRCYMAYYRRPTQVEWTPASGPIQSILNAPLNLNGPVVNRSYEAAYLPAAVTEVGAFANTGVQTLSNFGINTGIFADQMGPSTNMETALGGAADYVERDSISKSHTVLYYLTNCAGVEFSLTLRRCWEGNVRPTYYPYITTKDAQHVPAHVKDQEFSHALDVGVEAFKRQHAPEIGYGGFESAVDAVTSFGTGFMGLPVEARNQKAKQWGESAANVASAAIPAVAALLLNGVISRPVRS